jgi:shikimate dehydrogenase
VRTFGLIGYPLSHSFSKNYFAEKFLHEKLHDCQYQNFPLTDIGQLHHLIQQEKNLVGLNVTIPYKEAVIPLLTELDEAAKNIGAVNTIKFSSGKMIGYNTDYIGLLRSLKPLLQPHHEYALILGTGGSSKAVQYVLSLLNITYTFVSRTKTTNTLLYAEVDKNIIEDTTLIINTTPLGMFPDINIAPEIPYTFLSEKHLLFDLIYNPAETLFLQKGKQQDATIMNGLTMLQIQAEESWKIWNGF